MKQKTTAKHRRKTNELSIGMYDPLKLKVRRLGALILDWYIMNVIAAVPVTFWLRGNESIQANSFDLVTYGMPKGLIYGLIVLALCVVYYVIVPTCVWQGQTLGKKICGIRVIRMDGNEVGIFDMCKREILGAAVVEGGFSVMGTYLRQFIEMAGFTAAVTPVMYISYALTVASVVVAIFDKKGCAIHDKIAGTVTVRAL